MKYLVILVLVAGIVGGGWWLYHKKQLAAQAAAAASVQTEEVAYRDIEKMVSANGAVASNIDVDIKCQASGFIKTLPYRDVSAQIQPGAVLCEVDPIDEQRLLDTANAVVDGDKARIQEAQNAVQQATLALVTTKERDDAALASAKAVAAQTKAKADRTKALFDQKLESQEDLDNDQAAAAQAAANVDTAQAAEQELDQQKIDLQTKQTQIDEMKAALAQNQSQADTAKQNVAYCTVYAPNADDPKDPPHWVISSMLANIAPGYLVQSGASGFSAGTTIMTLSDLSHIFVLADVDESDIGQVIDPELDPKHTEQACVVTVDAYPGVNFEGVVKRVAPKGVNNSNVVTFEVKIEVTSPNRVLLRPLMTATAKIISISHPNVLAIPVSAFMRGDQGQGNGQKRTHQGKEGGSASTTMASADPPATGPAAVTDATTSASTAPGTTGPAASGPASRPGGRGRRGAGSADVVAAVTAAPDAPVKGTVEVVKSDGSKEDRDVVVGLSDGDYMEVLSGLQAGEQVVRNLNGGESKWSGQNTQRPANPRMIMR